MRAAEYNLCFATITNKFFIFTHGEKNCIQLYLSVYLAKARLLCISVRSIHGSISWQHVYCCSVFRGGNSNFVYKSVNSVHKLIFYTCIHTRCIAINNSPSLLVLHPYVVYMMLYVQSFFLQPHTVYTWP